MKPNSKGVQILRANAENSRNLMAAMAADISKATKRLAEARDEALAYDLEADLLEKALSELARLSSELEKCE